jgi:sortase (surface protein transpeptidase)
VLLWQPSLLALAASSIRRVFPLPRPAGRAGTPGVKPAARSVPLALSIPAIGVKVRLSELGLNPNHTVQVPASFQEPGWYEFGPSPGQLGSSVILGHVDSYEGPAVFFRLRSLRPGDHVDVTLADGVTTHFVVRQVATYPKTAFPTLSVYGSHGYSALQLVTCGGVFDARTRSYLSNVVVYTSLASIS